MPYGHLCCLLLLNPIAVTPTHAGKVCLSLLGTWSGEPWDPQHSNLSQLLISILAFIFTTEPLRNEPGLENSGEKAIQVRAGM